MLRNLAFTLIAVVSVSSASTARATPAEIVVVLDTSASMSEPSGGPDGETKLDVARRVATRIVEAAARSRHRVGLLRFRQIDAVVEGGEGPRRVHEEDEEQCGRVADLLVPIAPTSAADAARWTDGVESDENPEVVALGDSPLYGAVRVAIRYLRARRNANPLVSCVNAFVVVITDGRDTCAAGAELENALTELRGQSVTEDIRGLVLAFDPDGEAAELLAHLGHPDDGEARPYGPDDADAIVEAVGDIEGRLAPEACVESGVAPEALGLPTTPPVGPSTPPPPAPDDGAGEDGGGCTAAGPSSAGLHTRWVILLAGLASVVLSVALRSRARRRAERRTRRRSAVVALVGLIASLSACGDDDGSSPGDGDAAMNDDGGTPPAMLSDPSEAARLALARLDAILAAAERVRAEHLRPMLDPDRVFEAIDGDPVESCTALVRSMGYEPYLGAQRGVDGCIATRRCNALDLALVLQACLDSKGTSSELHRCAPDIAFRAQLVSEADRAPVMPDLTASGDALETALVDATMAEAPLADDIRSQYPKFVDYVDRDVGDAVDEDVRRLMPHVALDADDADLWADNRAESGTRAHYYVDVGGDAIDPVLEGSPAETGRCTGALADVADEATTVRMQVLVSYADVEPRSTSFAAPVVVAEMTWLAYERWGRYATMAVVDAGTRSVPDGVPPAASSGCLRALLQTPDGATTIGAPFFIANEDASDCPAMMAVEAAPGRQLASVILRTEVAVGSEVSSLDRVLVDRYGYALRTDGAHESGPMFSAEAARTLAPMRVDLLVAGGIPGPHKLADVLLEDLIERRDELARNLAATYGVPDTGAVASSEHRLRPLAWATLGAFARYASDRLPENAFSLELRPSRMAVVRRRGYGATSMGLGLGPQTIFDIVEHPVVVVSPDGDTTDRLRANVALGALVTEAERIATTGAEGAFEVIHAGAMLRDDATGEWAPYGSDDDHSQAQFPLSVIAAHRNRMLNGEDLIVTPGAAPFEGGEYVAWWRMNTRTGQVLGEVRYDGTFYGGVAPVKAIGIYDACLFAASILSLQDGRTIPDQECCFELATRDLLDGILQSHMWNIAFMAYFTPEAYGWDAGGVVAPTRSIGSVWTLLHDTVDLVMRQRELLNAPEPMCVTEE